MIYPEVAYREHLIGNAKLIITCSCFIKKTKTKNSAC